MDPRRLKAFLVLAEEKSFHKAAERLYLSQPALTQRIQALERELGVRLLERRPFRGSSPSSGGRSKTCDGMKTV